MYESISKDDKVLYWRGSLKARGEAMKVFLIIIIILLGYVECESKSSLERSQYHSTKEGKKQPLSPKYQFEKGPKITKVSVYASKEDPFEELTYRTYDIIYHEGIIYRATSGGVIGERLNLPETSLQRISSVKLPGSTNHLLIEPKQNLIFAFNGPEGIFILKIREDKSLQPYLNIDTEGSAISGKIYKDYLLVADGSGGLVLFSNGGEGKFTLFGVVDVGGYVRDIEVEGDKGYLAISEKGVGVVDLNNIVRVMKGLARKEPTPTITAETNPDLIKIRSTEGEARDLELIKTEDDIYIVVANGYSGVSILRERDLKTIWNYKTTDIARVVKVYKDNILLVGIGPDGIMSFSIKDIEKPQFIDKKEFKLAIIGITPIPETDYILCAYDSGGMLVLRIDTQDKFQKVFALKE